MYNYTIDKKHKNSNILEETRIIIKANNINEAIEIVKNNGGIVLEASDEYKKLIIEA